MTEPRVTKPHHGGAHHGDNGTITRVVIHDEEYALSSTSAESIASYFAGPTHGPSCAHYVIDSNSEQHCGHDSELMYHAPPNSGSVGIERDGYASWDAKEWAQPAAQRTTCNVAARAAELCLRHKVPTVWLSPTDVKAGKHGVTSHANVTAAFHQSTHTDPGPNFPAAAFIGLVQKAAGEWKAGSTMSVLSMGAWLYSGDDDMPLNDADKKWFEDTLVGKINQAVRGTVDVTPPGGGAKTSLGQAIVNGIWAGVLRVEAVAVRIEKKLDDAIASMKGA